MKPEDFDMKARQASEETFPPFDNEAWNKMEMLLDKHLPQQKEKRRFFFWWFAALIPVVLIGGYYLIDEYNNNTKQSAKQNSAIHERNGTVTYVPKVDNKEAISAKPANEAANSKEKTPSINHKTNEKIDDVLNDASNEKPSFAKSSKNIASNKNDRKLSRNNIVHSFKSTSTNDGTITASQSKEASAIKQKEMRTNSADKTSIPSNNSITDKVNDKPEPIKSTGALDNQANDKPVSATNNSSAAIKENNALTSNGNTIVKKRTPSKNFYFTLTTGLEANGTSLNNAGALKPVYGAGLQYSLGKLFLRTGVLFTKKVYAAKDKDYNRKTGTWMSIVTFDKIDANCKVVEVPVSIGYKLSSNKTRNTYVTAGTSAYFMKKEDYQFYFKNPSGSDTTRGASFTNNSNHFFSSINLSAGIEQKVTSRFSITAEPTISIPLSGIGFGKVKLYSAGLLVTVKVRLK